MKHADMGGNHHGASSRDYLTCRVVGYDADNLFVEHPWSLRILRIPVAGFPYHLQEHITDLKEVVRDGNGTAELQLQADDPRLRLVSDFHAGDPARKRLEVLGFRWIGDHLPTTQEEAPGMNLYSVILIDTYNKIVIDTKVVAKNDEAAKLAAGVYGWLQENGRTFDDVTVCVGHLCRVRERMTGPGE